MNLKKIWTIAWPVMLSNITVPLLGMVDITVVGHSYPRHILGAVAIGAMIFDVLFFLFGFLRMSTTGLIAQSPKDINIFYRALLIALSIAFLVLISQNLIYQAACFLIQPEQAVMQALANYFYLRLYAAPATLGNFVIFGYFFGRQNTKVPLLLLMLINTCAIGLDVILVSYQNLGIKGLAIANVIAQTAGFVAGLRVLYKKYIAGSMQKNNQVKQSCSLFNGEAILRLFHLNKDIFMRTLCLMATFTYFTGAGNYLGTTVVAANAILLSMHQFTACALDGFAIACEVLIGNAIGKKNKGLFKQALKGCGYCSLGIALLLSGIYYFVGPSIIRLMTSLPHVSQTAQSHLIWMILLPILSAGGFLLDGVFIGATWSKPMRNAMICSTLMVYFPLAYLLKPLGNNGLWLAFSSFMLSRGIFLGVILFKKWRTGLFSNLITPNV